MVNISQNLYSTQFIDLEKTQNIYKTFVKIMIFRTRLVNFLFNRSESSTSHFLLQDKHQLSIDKLTQMLCLLLIGFLVGNLFGTFLNTIRTYVTWDGVIVFFIISGIEISNYNVYHNKKRPFCLFILHPQIIKRSFWKLFNFFKIGLMVGFFVDAFKVGS